MAKAQQDMTSLRPEDRHILFLQGPHGPFFNRLARQLHAAGCRVSRVGFNRGDEFFWAGLPGYIPYRGAPADWPATFAGILEHEGITEIALYGDVRPHHAEAIAIARDRGLVVHIFEEGYLRPFWATYERGGSNGYSRLMQISLPQMRAALAARHHDSVKPPASWGDMREHMFYGAAYHFLVLAANGAYPQFRSHRAVPVRREFLLNLRKVVLTPWRAAQRWRRTRRVMASGAPYHIVLMQLEHDSNFTAHSDFATMGDFTHACIAGFAAGAPRHHRLVFKAHPLEDDRGGLEQRIRDQARKLGVETRVETIPGGKLAALLAQARSAVTVNSTAAQQALLRGIPVRAMGRAVFAKPELVSDQPLADFFADPAPPDHEDYACYRQFLLESSQVPGGYYATASRQHLLRQVVDLMLAAQDPYDRLMSGKRLPGRPQLDDR